MLIEINNNQNNMTNKTHTPALLASLMSIAAMSIFALLSTGCEDAAVYDGASWNASTVTDTTSGGSTTTTTGGSTTVTNMDAVSYGSLNWTYGGVKHASASFDSSVILSGLSFSSSSLSFTYVKDLSNWGLSFGDAGALACLFVQKADGSWVGGKFDWISSSRTSRGLSHTSNYNGWTLAGVPNPCAAAFVIVSADGKKRSNVLAGTWSR